MIPTRWTLQVKRSTVETVRGEQIRTYGDPEDWPVFGYAPGDNSLPMRQLRDESDIEWTVYAPVNEKLPAEFDKVALAGADYLVAGRPKDWTHGPWPDPNAGATVLLKRTEG